MVKFVLGTDGFHAAHLLLLPHTCQIGPGKGNLCRARHLAGHAGDRQAALGAGHDFVGKRHNFGVEADIRRGRALFPSDIHDEQAQQLAHLRRGQAVLMANPEVLHASGQMREHDEASPNLPGVSAVISRPRAVTVRFLNEKGEVEERDFVHLWATSVQHQIDHLQGKMYFDHLSPLKRKMLLAKAAKLNKR